MSKKNSKIISEDFLLPSTNIGGEIFVRHLSKGNPKIHFLLVHGAMEHSGRYPDLIHFFLDQYPDVAISVFDHTGHGRSSGTRVYVDKFYYYVEDFKKVSDAVYSRIPDNCKKIILAHSLGGLITLTGLLDPVHEISFIPDGVVFSAPCIRPHIVMGSLTLPILDTLSKVAPKVHLPSLYSGKDLSRDPERANNFDTDPLIPKYLTARMASEIVEASQKIISLSYYLKIPCLFLIAGQDKVVDAASTILFSHGVDKRLTHVIEYPEHYHELWNEIDRQKIFFTMKKWIDEKIKEGK